MDGSTLYLFKEGVGRAGAHRGGVVVVVLSRPCGGGVTPVTEADRSPGAGCRSLWRCCPVPRTVWSAGGLLRPLEDLGRVEFIKRADLVCFNDK